MDSLRPVAPRLASPSPLRIGLVGAGRGGSAVLDLLLGSPGARVVVVIDCRPDAPGIQRARSLGIAAGAHPLEVFEHAVDLVLEVTGQPAVLTDLLRVRPPGVEVIGAGALRFFWDLLGEARAARDFLRSIADNSADAIVTTDVRGRVTYFSPGAEQILGFSAKEMVGRRAADHYRGGLPEARALMERLPAEGPIRNYETALRTKAGGWAEVSSSISLLRDPMGAVVGTLAVIKDITERKRAEETTATLAEVGQELAGPLDLRSAADRVVSAVLRLFHARRASLYLVDSLSGTPTCVAAHGEGAERWVGRTLPAGTGLAGRVIADARPLWSSDSLADPRFKFPPWVVQTIRELGHGSAVGVPLMAKGETLGALILADAVGRAYSDHDLRVLSMFANHAALSISNARLLEETGRRARQAAVLGDLTAAMNASLELDTVLERVTEGAQELCGSDMAKIALRDPGSGAMLIRYRVGAQYQGYEAVQVEPGKGAGGQVLLTGHAFRTDCYTDDPRISEEFLEVAAEEGIVALLAVPIRVADRIEGVLYVHNRSPRPFTDRDEAILLQLADHAALAIQNARLYQQAHEQARKLTTLSTLTRLITSATESRAVFRSVASAAITLLGAKFARVWVADPTDQVLRAHGEVGLDSHLAQVMADATTLPYGTGLVGSVFESRMPEYCCEVQLDPRTRNLRFAREAGLYAFTGIPLRVGDKVWGVLAMFFGDRGPFTGEEKELMNLLADQAAIAIANARLFEDTERRRQTAERLAAVGRLVSQSLDPREVGRLIVDSVGELFDTRSAALFRLEPGTGDLVALAASGEIEEVFGTRVVFPQGAGVAGLAVRSREPVVTRNLLTDPRVTLPPDIRNRVERDQFRSVLAVPLLARGEVIGALTVGDQPGRVFEPYEIELTQAFADQAAIALENSRLYGELRGALEQLQSSQQQLIQAERLRALGEMAAGVAHDFNNLLAIVLGRAELLRARVSDPDLARGLEAIHRAARNGAQTIRRIQEFTRTRQTRPFGRVDLLALVHQVVELTRPRWKDEAQSRGVTYDIRVEGGPVPPVAGIAEELHEVFMNLLTNALEAMPAGGEVRFCVCTEGEWVAVHAEDTGSGMSEETRRRVFEPFFTTKGPRGSGLGLAVAWGIVTRHDGRIEVESAPGKGSTFTVRLPINLALLAEAPPESLPKAPWPARVLVIDDEPEVRHVLAEMLTIHGYTVLEAADGPEGLARSKSERVDLVLTDLSMPGMSGWEVATVCQANAPRIPIGLVTGWGDRLDEGEIKRHGIQFVLAKPFETREVLTRVAQALLRSNVLENGADSA